MRYDNLEAELVAKLNEYFAATDLSEGVKLDTVFEAREFPDTEDEFSRIEDKGFVNVNYMDSQYGQNRAGNHIIQDETIAIGLFIQANRVRGDKGSHALIQHVKDCLLGFKPTNCKNALVISGYGDWNMKDGMVGPFLEMTTATVNQQKIPSDEPAIGGPLGTINGKVPTPAGP